MVTYIKNLGVTSNETAIKIDVDDAFQFEVQLAQVNRFVKKLSISLDHI